tara:strand:- start:610 stop:813 length:204 start_codon:yes stop_codon:yes gene_type:complete
MKEFLLVISMWGNNGMTWQYIGNQYIMQELFTKEQCQSIADKKNWESVINNQYYAIQFDCFHKDRNL